jgi:hypothetical protein
MPEPFFRWKAKVDKRLTAAEGRLDDHDEELSELTKDLSMLADLCARARQREAKRMQRRTRRSRQPAHQ